MAIRMPGPVALGTHRVFHLNIRVPQDLAAKLRGAAWRCRSTATTSPSRSATRSWSPCAPRIAGEAKLRFQHAAARLDAFFTAMRAAPKALSYKDIVALSGEAYRRFVEHVRTRSDRTISTEPRGSSRTRCARSRYDGEPALPREDAEFLATLALPEGPRFSPGRVAASISAVSR